MKYSHTRRSMIKDFAKKAGAISRRNRKVVVVEEFSPDEIPTQKDRERAAIPSGTPKPVKVALFGITLLDESHRAPLIAVIAVCLTVIICVMMLTGVFDSTIQIFVK